jgi:ABC-2 type transport system permease protein
MQIVGVLKNKLSDTIIMSGRCLRHAFRSIDTLITVIAMPIIMMLMFVYVFGGAINTGSVDYSNYVVPGIVIFTIVSSVAYTAVRLNMDATTGIFDRFLSMPIAKSSIISGHVLTSVVFSAFSTVMVMLVALLMGFRPKAGIIEWLLVIGILLLFTTAMTWIAVISGLLANSAEGAGVFAYPIMILPFVSSAFAPTASMHGAVRAFAENQPMTPIIDTVRSLLMNKPVGNNALIAVLWCVGILVVSYSASMFIYKRKTA